MTKYSPEYLALLAQRDDLDQRIAELRLSEVRDAIKRAKDIIEAYDLTADDLGLSKGTSGSKKTTAKTETAKNGRQAVEAKYRDPVSGATWSGRGKAPKWLQGTRDDYLIDASSSNVRKIA